MLNGRRMSMPNEESLLRRLAAVLRERAFILKAGTFGVIGAVNAAVDFAVFSFAYFWLMLAIVPANLAAWCVAVTCSYVLNTMITFAAESGRRLAARTYLNFLLAQVAGFVANTTTVLAASYVMPVLYGKLLALGASFVVNFSLSYFVVFRRRGETGQAAGPSARPSARPSASPPSSSA